MQLDGPNQTGIGFALSIERLLLALEEENIDIVENETLDLFIVTMGEANHFAVKLLMIVVKISADKDYLNRKIKGQMKQADRLNATYTIVIGDQELDNQIVEVKHMESGNSETVKFENLLSYFK